MEGRCSQCNKTFSKAEMTEHLKSCLKDDGKTKLLHILVDGLSQPEYWLHIEIPADAELKDLDNFLKDVWLECCGHLSEFEIDGRNYDEDMDTPLNRILNPGMEFYHIYDFGTPTELRLKVISGRKGEIGEEKVRILARNDPLDKRCSCGKKANWVCTVCIMESMGDCYFCDECAEEHECGEDMLLPVVNSPRCGVCGYEGSDKYGD